MVSISKCRARENYVNEAVFHKVAEMYLNFCLHGTFFGSSGVIELHILIKFKEYS